ncbi:MAG: hypothetical protein NTZ09_11175, partial [Candidatus Hydrogenedentes bacterium]|nr:hypothetical protein [Candidatus Hydrogenedentota bacterium]
SRIKDRPETCNSRVLAISGFIEDEEARQLVSYGFDGYLKKPFGISELVEQVNRLLEMPNAKVARPRRNIRAS